MAPPCQLTFVERGEDACRSVAPGHFGAGVGITEPHLRDVLDDVLLVSVREMRSLRLHDALGDRPIQHLRRHEFEPSSVGRLVDLRFVTAGTVLDVKGFAGQCIPVAQIADPGVLLVHRAQRGRLGFCGGVCRCRCGLLLCLTAHQYCQSKNNGPGT